MAVFITDDEEVVTLEAVQSPSPAVRAGDFMTQVQQGTATASVPFWASMNEVMKENYIGGIREQLNKSNLLMKVMQEKWDVKEVEEVRNRLKAERHLKNYGGRERARRRGRR